MPRTVSSALKRAISRQQTDEAFLVLLDIDYPGRAPDSSDTQLRGAWLSSETAKTADDYSSAGDDMTAFGGPVWPDEGVTLNGTTQYLMRAEADWRSTDTAGTVMGWVRRSTAGVNHTVFASADESGTAHYWRLYVRSSNRLAVESAESGDPTDEIEGSTTIAADTWHHLAVVSDGATWNLYVDGALESLSVVAGGNNGDWLSEVTLRDNITIGVLHRSSLTNYFAGTIRDVRYYSRALGAAEINAAYLAGLLTPIRVVNDYRQVIAGNKVYLPFAFEIAPPDEREDAAIPVELRIDNVDRRIVSAIRAITTAPVVTMRVVLASQPEVTEVGPYVFALRKLNYDAQAVVGTLELEDMLREPIPGHSFTPTDFPGLFAGVT